MRVTWLIPLRKGECMINAHILLWDTPWHRGNPVYRSQQPSASSQSVHPTTESQSQDLSQWHRYWHPGPKKPW